MRQPLSISSSNFTSLIYLIEGLAGFSRGAFLVCFGWTTLVLTGDIAKVGQIFVVSMLTLLFGSHLVGILVDSKNRKRIIILSHLIIALLMAMLGWSLIDPQSFNVLVFFFSVVVLTFSRISHESAIDAALKQFSKPELLTTLLARARTVHLLGKTMMTVVTGWCLSVFNIHVAFYVAGASSALVLAAALFLPSMPPSTPKTSQNNQIANFFTSFSVFKVAPTLLPLVLLAGLALPVGKLSNAILSSFVRDDLGLQSFEFGIIDGAWSIGGLLAAFILSVLPNRQLDGVKLSYTAGVLALCTIWLGLTSELSVLVVLHGAMGFFCWIIRILVEVRVLNAVPDELAGRAKSNVIFAFSAIAIVMCLSPGFVSAAATGSYYVFWGYAIGAAALLYHITQSHRIKTS